MLALVVLPAAARADGTVYVGNLGSANVSQYAIGAKGLLSPLSPATVAAGSFPNGVTVTPDGKSAFVTNNSSNTVSQYDVDPRSGALSPKTPATVATNFGPIGIAVAPDGKSAYVADAEYPVPPDFRSIGTVSQYDIDPGSGALSPKTPATVATLSQIPTSIAVTPGGTSAYVTATGGDNLVSQYDIDPGSGALSPKTPATVTAGFGQQVGVAVTPSGKSAFVTNNGSNTVSQYDIDPGSGALSPKTPATVATGASPWGVAVTPDGKSAYVTCVSAHAICQYDIDPRSGALSPKTPATVAAGDFSAAIAVTPDGKSAYVTNTADSALDTVLQYDIDPRSGALSPKTPANIAAGTAPQSIAVGSLPRAPTKKKQCKCGGWHNFRQFESKGRCVAFVERRSKR
jgi:DNA-binding beta-propeller fold protein YncE